MAEVDIKPIKELSPDEMELQMHNVDLTSLQAEKAKLDDETTATKIITDKIANFKAMLKIPYDGKRGLSPDMRQLTEQFVARYESKPQDYINEKKAQITARLTEVGDKISQLQVKISKVSIKK